MIGTALVGLGDIGCRAHLPALRRHPRVHLATLVDTSVERAERARRATGTDVGVVADLDEVLTDERILAVVLATPPWATPELAVRALTAGRYVLAEKPIATSVSAASTYDKLGDAETRRLQIGLTYRHDPAIAALGEILASGRLGEPLLVRAHVYDEELDPTTPEHTERMVEALAHGTPVLHEGAHVFDWLTVLLGATPAVEDAWSVRTTPDFPAANVVGARLRYGRHVVLTEFGWLTDALPRPELSVLGPHGHARLDLATFRLETSTSTGRQVHEFTGDRVIRCFDQQLARFVELVDGTRATPEPDLAAGRAALDTSERVAAAAGTSP